MFKAWFKVAEIPAGGFAWSPGDIPLVRARTVSLTCKVKYDASATKGVTVKVYYSPNGKSWDTVAIDDFDVDLTAGQTVQKTYLVAVPEHGYLRAQVVNNDSSVSVKNVTVWYSIQSWAGKGVQEEQIITRDVGEA